MSTGQVPPGPPAPDWRHSVPKPEVRTSADGSARGKKLFFLLAFSLALISAVVGLFFYLGSWKPLEFQSFAIREYKSPLFPVNALAYQDSRLLAKRFSQGNVDSLYNVQEGALMRRELDGLRKKTEGPVVIHLSALARWREGKVFLLGADAVPDRMDAWVPLREVLQKMRECPAHDKLLILDISRSGPDERFGLFRDDIAGKVQATLAKEKDLPFFVLSACSAGQTAWVSEQWGQSLFAYYLDRGLLGYADGHGPKGKLNGLITVSELADYVKSHVDHCAWETRGVRQTSFLMGHCQDFPLVRIASQTSEKDEEKQPSATYPAWLLAGWAERDKGRSEMDRFGPGVLRTFEAELLRTEQGWRGGLDESENGKKEESRLKNQLKLATERFKSQSKRIADNRRPPLPHSLPPLKPENKKSSQEFAYSLGIILSKAVEAPAKIDDSYKAHKEEEDKGIKGLEAFCLKNPEDAAQVLFETSLPFQKLGPSQISLLHQILKTLPLEKNRFAQTLYLERLQTFAQLVKENSWDWPMAAVRQSIRTMLEAERLLAEVGNEPSALPWVVELIKEGDKNRRAGEKELFSGQDTDWAKAEKELSAAGKIYTSALARVQGFTKARMARDRALNLLSTISPILLTQPKESSLETKAWKDAVSATQKLIDVLSKPEPNADIEGPMETVSTLCHFLQGSLETKMNRCLNVGKRATGEDYSEVQALLNSPGLEGPKRMQLWDLGREWENRFLEKIQVLDNAEMVGKPKVLPPLSGEPDAGYVLMEKKLRFQQAIGMIHLAGFDKGNLLEKKLQSVGKNEDEETWQALAESVLVIWPRQVLFDFNKDEQNLLRADRIERTFSPFDLEEYKNGKTPNHWSQNPTWVLYRKDRGVFWQFLSQRCQADAGALEKESPLQIIYREWADEYEEAGRFEN